MKTPTMIISTAKSGSRMFGLVALPIAAPMAAPITPATANTAAQRHFTLPRRR